MTPSPHDSLLGREIDGYRIEKLLGEGGMARVYRGQDVRLGRYVAIKVIEPEARADPEYAARFEKEARAVAQLEHPHIVRIYRFGEVDGLYYMAMQYIDGADLGWILADYARDKELMPHDDVLRVMSQIGAALDYAHSKGVIHRDVKPSNIMLDKEGRAILTDFGLVLLQAEGTRGEIFGTPHYIAPEQAVNSSGAVPQSDQYALGVILYQALTGSLPYEGKSAMDIALAHMTEPLPSPLERNPDLSPVMVALLEKALQKEPADRYPSCAALVVDLERAIKAPGRQPSTVKRFSLVSVPEQVQAFRSANPLPPLPPGVVPSPAPPTAPAQPQANPATSKPKSQPSIAASTRAVTNQRQMWTMIGIVSLVVILIGAVAVVMLFSKRAGVPASLSGTPTTADQNSRAVLPTATSEPAATSTQVTPSATSTQLPSATIVPPVSTAARDGQPSANYALLIATRDQDSVFVLNITVNDFPLQPLRLGDGEGGINGAEWGVDMLKNGQCVAAWKDAKDNKRPDITCKEVGGHLTRDPKRRFWKAPFNVYYGDALVATCATKSCLVRINAVG